MLIDKCLRFVLAAAFLAGSGAALLGQEAGTSGQPPQKTLEKTPITRSNPASGREMYKDYCAACHGASGKGDGPAAELLKTAPPDLTTMAKRNGGKFPSDHFVAILHFGTEGHAHGTTDMPVWGPLFRTQNKDVAELRVSNLTSYVESIQQK
jgi:mono/diheme cytochrome c family protein